MILESKDVWYNCTQACWEKVLRKTKLIGTRHIHSYGTDVSYVEKLQNNIN